MANLPVQPSSFQDHTRYNDPAVLKQTDLPKVQEVVDTIAPACEAAHCVSAKTHAPAQVDTSKQMTYFEMVQQWLKPENRNNSKKSNETTKDVNHTEKAATQQMTKADVDDVRTCLQAINDLIAEMKKVRKGGDENLSFEFEDLQKLNHLFYLTQQDMASMTAEQIKFVQQEKRKYNAEQLAKMQEILDRAKQTKFWSHMEAIASGASMAAAGVGIGGPLGVVAVVFAVGMTVEHICNDPAKKAIANLLAGGDSEKMEQWVFRLQLGIAVAAMAFTVGSFGWMAVRNAPAPGVHDFWTFINALKAGNAPVHMDNFSKSVKRSLEILGGVVNASSIGVNGYLEHRNNNDQADVLIIRENVGEQDLALKLYLQDMNRFVEGFMRTVSEMSKQAKRQSEQVSFILRP